MRVDDAIRLLALKNLEKTEEVMNNVWFPEPVTLKFSTTSRNVATSFEALECLDQQWPEWGVTTRK